MVLATLDSPFTDILWSAPCQSWSTAGGRAGLNASVGALFVHILGILYLFRPLRSLGENVDGLVQHPPALEKLVDIDFQTSSPFSSVQLQSLGLVPYGAQKVFSDF